MCGEQRTLKIMVRETVFPLLLPLYMQWACIISPRAHQETGTILGRDKIIKQFSNSGLRLINLHHHLVRPTTRNSHVYVCSSAFVDRWRLQLRLIRFYTVLSSQYLFGIWHKHMLFKLYKWFLWKKRSMSYPDLADCLWPCFLLCCLLFP